MAAAKKKKKTLRLLLLLLVVAALGAVYFLMDTGADEGIDELPTPTADATQSNLVLCDLSAEDLVKVRFENDTFSATVIRKEDGTCYFEEEPDFPINQTKANHVFDNLYKECELLLESADLAEYGLTDPALRIIATDKNEKTFTLNVGSRVGTVSENKYYACFDNETTVYCVPATLFVPYSLEKTAWIRLETLPDLTTTNIVGIEITSEEFGNLALYHTGGIGDADANPNTANWRMEIPYSNLLGLSEEKVTETIERYTGTSFSDPVDYKTENFALYGLENPGTVISVLYETDSAFSDEKLKQRTTLNIGDKTDDGYYYVNLAGSSLVYTILESSVKKLAQVDADSLVEKRFALIHIHSVAELEVKMGDITHLYELEHEMVADDNGAETVQKSIITVDGKLLPEESTAFNSYYTNFLNPKANRVIPEDTAVEGEPFFTLCYKRTDASYPDLYMEYFPFDDSNYAIRINGVVMYAVDKRAVDSLMQTINEYVPE